MSAAESGLIVPQSHTVEEPLVVPMYREDRFARVTQLAFQGGNVLPPHIVAAAVLTDKDCSEDAMTRQAVELAAAEDYISGHPGELFINANNAGLTAGIVAENHGLTVFRWNSPIDEATGLAIPSQGTVEVGFSSNRVRSVHAEVPSEQPARVITPETVVLSLTEEDIAARAILKTEAAALTPIRIEDSDELEVLVEGGILAAGTKAVTAFVEAVSKLPHRPESGHLKKALRIAMPILELERE